MSVGRVETYTKYIFGQEEGVAKFQPTPHSLTRNVINQDISKISSPHLDLEIKITITTESLLRKPSKTTGITEMEPTKFIPKYTTLLTGFYQVS